ncbi:hornerin-like [Iris pallida]|uniref:Hornerin-like n=1 Tax=Iris pallida TaxID=29817 RepID=A0AAX6FX75_IRIPA|nr:hornerin-like [Iris pallida]
MKNVAKCDTWCELQNPVNHRVFERKLRPRPSGRGHACLGVTPRVAPHPSSPPGGRRRADAEIGPPCLVRGGPKCGPSSGRARRVVDDETYGSFTVPRPSKMATDHVSYGPELKEPPTVRPRRQNGAFDRNATPGQAGLPAEFKHINKRRRRNLQGFP